MMSVFSLRIQLALCCMVALLSLCNVVANGEWLVQIPTDCAGAAGCCRVGCGGCCYRRRTLYVSELLQLKTHKQKNCLLDLMLVPGNNCLHYVFLSVAATLEASTAGSLTFAIPLASVSEVTALSQALETKRIPHRDWGVSHTSTSLSLLFVVFLGFSLL